MKWMRLLGVIPVLLVSGCARDLPPSVEGFCVSTAGDRDQLASGLAAEGTDRVVGPGARLIGKTDRFCGDAK